MPCDIYLWGSLKDKAYKRNPHTLHELEENIQEEYPHFLGRAAVCEPECVLMLQCMFTRRRGKYSTPPLNWFVSKLILVSCTTFTMAQFAEREPELPGAWQFSRWSKKKITTLYFNVP
jgi:hypothetical protein